MGHLLTDVTVQRRRSICSSVRHQTSFRRHFGFQIVQTSTLVDYNIWGVSFRRSLQQENPKCGRVATAYH